MISGASWRPCLKAPPATSWRLGCCCCEVSGKSISPPGPHRCLLDSGSFLSGVQRGKHSCCCPMGYLPAHMQSSQVLKHGPGVTELRMGDGKIRAEARDAVSPTFGHFFSSGTASLCAQSPLHGASGGSPGVWGGGAALVTSERAQELLGPN